MTQYAFRHQSASIQITPGQILTYRLPTTSPGYVVIKATRWSGPQPPPKPGTDPQPPGAGSGAGISPDMPGGGRPQGIGPMPHVRPAPIGIPIGPAIPPNIQPTVSAQPGDLIIEIMQGEQVAQTGSFAESGTLVQNAPSDGDSTWRVRFHLADGSPQGETYIYNLDVGWSSLLPILTKRIPLAFFQQGFDDNWNNRKYIYVTIDGNYFSIQFDDQLASYYKLEKTIISTQLPLITLKNIRTVDIHLDAGAEDSPFSYLHGHLPFFELTIGFASDNPHAPITVESSVFSIELPDFDFRLKFYLAYLGPPNITYVTKLESALLDRVPNFGRDLSGNEINPRKIISDAVETFLNQYGYAVGSVLRTWFLGADFDVLNIRHDPATSDIVVDYVGLQTAQDELVATGGDPGVTFTDPFLLEEVAYTPRGAGDSIWKPQKSGSSLPPPHHGGQSTTQGDLGKVDHIVVVVMENRSFDHMLGFLSRDNGRTDVEGLKQETNGTRTQFNYYNGRFFYPEKLVTTRIVGSPDHSHEAVKGQMADGMMHFVSDYAKKLQDDGVGAAVMGYYGGDQLRTYAMLADNFAICDHWFASHVGPTIPNRFVLLTGDLNRDSWGQPEVDTPDYKTFTPSETATLFDHLTERGVSWRYFQHRVSQMRLFTKYTFDMSNVVEYDNPTYGFHAVVSAGTLPSVTFVDPAFGDLPAGVGQPPDNDDAPPADLLDGQAFIFDVVHTLFEPPSQGSPPKGNPHWQKTMLIIVYDEHGGFYDHVDPPSDAVPLLGQNSGKLGPRVPAFVVSAYTPARTVLKDVFEHASIPATILRRFCSPQPPSMGPRVAAARDLRGALSLGRPRGALEMLPQGNVIVARQRPFTTARPFRAPTRPDDFGAFLAGALMSIGSSPR
jgi:phospholipase C